MNNANRKAIRLLIVEENPWVRDGLRVTFEGTEIEIVGEAATGTDAVCLASLEGPEVMLLDIRMTNGDGFDVIQKVRSANPELAVLIYSQRARVDFQDRARKLGASGYLSKRAGPKELIDAIRKASRRESLWSQSRDDSFEG